MSSAPSSPPTEKTVGGLLVLFLRLGVSFAPSPPKIFLPTTLDLSRAFKKKEQLSMRIIKN